MNAKLDTIILYVKNIKLLKYFYVENFNLKVVEEDEIWILLNAGNVNIGFHKIGQKYMQQIEPNHKFDNNTKIVFEIDDNLELIRKEFIEKNIPMRELKTFDNYNFWLCDGIDPEGNVFQLKKKKNQ
ncbi:VOC family protein [Flavobacterium sp. ZS1P14]|uniref:VOC family protein n=1 Tax=Flavobacterium sp. ZS1P14 TaxID=3401729 RepID=UPI003AADF7FA